MMATLPTTTLSYDDGLVAGVSVERDAGGVTVSVAPVPEGRRMLLGGASVVGIVIGPVAAAAMLAAGLGWVGPLIVLGLILAPAVLLRLAVFAAEREPVEGPEAVFKLDGDHLELTVQVRGGTWVKRWTRRDVDDVRPGWFGTGLVVRARGRVSAEVLHWHPLKVRARVADVLGAEIRRAGAGGGEGYNAAGAARPAHVRSRRRARPFL